MFTEAIMELAKAIMELASRSPHNGSQARSRFVRAQRLVKRLLVEHALTTCSGNRTYAAAWLGINRTYLIRLIAELEITIAPLGRSGVKFR